MFQVVLQKSALKDASSSPSAQPSKQVSFALRDSVNYIRPGDGTWENGPSSASNPTLWEVENQDHLTKEAFAEVERTEQAERSARQTRMQPVSDQQMDPVEPYAHQIRRKPVPVQSSPQNDAPERQMSRVHAGSVTFDDFLDKSQMAVESEPQKRSRKSSVMSVSSLASIKSLGTTFKRKLGGKDKPQT